MNNENYWKQFMTSGRVQDYLTYAREEGQNKVTLEKDDVIQRTKGEYPYAGFYCSDGNGIEPNSCR